MLIKKSCQCSQSTIKLLAGKRLFSQLCLHGELKGEQFQQGKRGSCQFISGTQQDVFQKTLKIKSMLKSTKHDLLKKKTTKKNPQGQSHLWDLQNRMLYESVCCCVVKGGGSWAYIHDYQFSKECTVLKPYYLKQIAVLFSCINLYWGLSINYSVRTILLHPQRTSINRYVAIKSLRSMDFLGV